MDRAQGQDGRTAFGARKLLYLLLTARHGRRRRTRGDGDHRPQLDPRARASVSRVRRPAGRAGRHAGVQCSIARNIDAMRLPSAD